VITTSDTAARAAHWNDVYTRRDASSVSWYAPHLDASIALLERAGLGADSRVLDVGGGASTLVDDVLDRVASVTVLDLSAAALDVARHRLGERASRVQWLAADITTAVLAPGGFTHWHDRAVLHFLTAEADARAYAEQCALAVVPGGHAVLGGFAPDGPQRCSGLEVARRSAAEVAHLLGEAFSLVHRHALVHRTPAGADQAFEYAVLRRV
jgi:SAM-dependent methyltransferase